jgi:hypothetical protein
MGFTLSEAEGDYQSTGVAERRKLPGVSNSDQRESQNDGFLGVLFFLGTPMTETKKIQELTRISAFLSDSVISGEPKEWRQIVRKTIRRIDDVIERLEAERVSARKVE